MPELLLSIRANSDSAKRLRLDLSAHDAASERSPSWPAGPDAPCLVLNGYPLSSRLGRHSGYVTRADDAS